MTTTSPRGGRRRFATTIFDAQSCLDAYFVRDTLINNALHAADEGGAGVFVNWVAADASKISGNPTLYQTTGTGLAINEWHPIARYFPIHLPVFATRAAYKLRVRLYGASTVALTSVKFGVAVGIDGRAFEALTYTSPGGAIEFAATTSTTPAWLSPSVPASDLITVPLPLVESCLVPEATLDDTGGVRVETPVHEIGIYVYGQSAGTGAHEAALYGLHVAGFVG